MAPLGIVRRGALFLSGTTAWNAGGLVGVRILSSTEYGDATRMPMGRGDGVGAHACSGTSLGAARQ